MTRTFSTWLAGPLVPHFNDSDRVFGEILGLSPDEQRTLERDGVFQ